MSYDKSVLEDDCVKLSSKLASEIEEFRNKTVMIAGCNGLVGGFLTDFFVHLNETKNFGIKLILTSLSGVNDEIRAKNVTGRNDVISFSWDLSKRIDDSIKSVIPQADYVFFCAGYGQPKKFIHNRMSTIFLNTAGLDSLLEHFSNEKCKFLYLSSSEVYGNPDSENIPTTESYNGNYSTESNRACYISSKRLGEVICLERQRIHKNLDVKIARLALAYGPGVLRSDDRVLQDFFLKGSGNGEIRLLDEGKAVRNYIYISDCAEILLKMSIGGTHRIYNVGGEGEPVTIFELAQKVGDLLQISVHKGTNISDAVSAAPNKVALDMKRYVNDFQEIENPTRLSEGLMNLKRWFQL